MKFKKPQYVIVCKSDMLGKFAPTLHGKFNSYSDALAHGEKNIRETEFKVEVAKPGDNC